MSETRSSETETRTEFESLMERVRAGCQDAATELFEKYGPAVRRVVRRWLEVRLRRYFDPEDFEQSVWGSFFITSADRYTFTTSEDLIAFLSKLAYNKVMDATRKGWRRSQNEEHSLDAPGDADDPNPLAKNVPAPTHTPSKFVMADERWQQLTRNLPAGHIRILELMLEGHSQTEIAARLGFDRKVIQRLLDQLQGIASQI